MFRSGDKAPGGRHTPLATRGSQRSAGDQAGSASFRGNFTKQHADTLFPLRSLELPATISPIARRNLSAAHGENEIPYTENKQPRGGVVTPLGARTHMPRRLESPLSPPPFCCCSLNWCEVSLYNLQQKEFWLWEPQSLPEFQELLVCSDTKSSNQDSHPSQSLPEKQIS